MAGVKGDTELLAEKKSKAKVEVRMDKGQEYKSGINDVNGMRQMALTDKPSADSTGKAIADSRGAKKAKQPQNESSKGRKYATRSQTTLDNFGITQQRSTKVDKAAQTEEMRVEIPSGKTIARSPIKVVASKSTTSMSTQTEDFHCSCISHAAEQANEEHYNELMASMSLPTYDEQDLDITQASLSSNSSVLSHVIEIAGGTEGTKERASPNIKATKSHENQPELKAVRQWGVDSGDMKAILQQEITRLKSDLLDHLDAKFDIYSNNRKCWCDCCREGLSTRQEPQTDLSNRLDELLHNIRSNTKSPEDNSPGEGEPFDSGLSVISDTPMNDSTVSACGTPDKA